MKKKLTRKKNLGKGFGKMKRCSLPQHLEKLVSSVRKLKAPTENSLKNQTSAGDKAKRKK
ncbi:MAG: hypothetical protein OXF67_01800 [Cyanobacteria bacterium MAG CAR4_bin_6]|nr:hypothetical protein [Cyanobacteria bacterium MAG CAR4_bin_6]